MCTECKCEALGSSTGVTSITITDVSKDGESGLSNE